MKGTTGGWGVGQRTEQETRLEGPEDGIAGAGGLHACTGTVRVQGRVGRGVSGSTRVPPPTPDPDPRRSPSLMSGLASLDAKTSSRLGILTVAYYLWTTFVAVIVGIIMVSIIHPGGAAQKETMEQSGKAIMSSADALLDLIR